MRAVCYARVSSVAQRERDTIASQLREVPEFVSRMGWQLVGTYVDDGHTARAGHLEERAGLSALLRDAALAKFDVVAVVDLDRLTRSEDLAERGAVLGAFQRAGVKIASAHTGQVLDLSTSSGDLFATLHAFFAAEENRKRSERVRAGKISAAQRGRKVGLGPYGLAYDRETNAWTIDPKTAPIVREIFERVAEGESCWALAVDLNARGIPFRQPGRVWARGRVYDLLNSRHPVGEWVAHVATHTIVSVPAIITEELWQRAQDALVAGRKAALRKTKHVYLLEGLARCGACGGRMFVQSGVWETKGRKRYWRPAMYICEFRKTLPTTEPRRCNAPRPHVEDVDARAWRSICAELDDPDLPAELAADRRAIAADERDWERDAEGFRAHLARLEKVAAAVLVRFRRGAITESELDVELGGVNRERAAVRAQLATAERARGATVGAQARLREATASLERMRAKMASASPEERREIALGLIDPGGVILAGSSIRLELFVHRPASSECVGGRSAAGGSRSDGHEGRLRIRVVA